MHGLRSETAAKAAVLLRVYKHIESNRLKYAGGGEHAHVPLVQAIECNVLSLFRHHIKSETARTDEAYAGTFVSVVDIGSLWIVQSLRILADIVPVRVRDPVPKRKYLPIYRFKQFPCHSFTCLLSEKEVYL